MNLEKYATINKSHRLETTTSDKYAFIPTTRALAVLADHGWMPSRVQEAPAWADASHALALLWPASMHACQPVLQQAHFF